MRRASLAALAILTVALLAGCGSGNRSATAGGATVTVPSGVDSVRGEVNAILDQFPYQRWYTSCVKRRFAGALGPDEEATLSEVSASDRERKLSQIIGRIGPACKADSNRPLVDPDATSAELDLLRAELVPTAERLAGSKGLDPEESACVAEAFERLPDRYIVKFGNGDGRSRGAIILTVFRTCVEAHRG